MNKISNETKLRLKQMYADPDSGWWDWDQGTWRWECSLRDSEGDLEGGQDIDSGYVAIVPLQNRTELEYPSLPAPDHDEWGICFVAVNVPEPCFVAKGTIEDVKRRFDALLMTPTPNLPAPGEGPRENKIYE
jgi:hypothetical protein